MDTPSYDLSLDEHLRAIKRYSRSPPIFSRDFAYADSSPVILSERSRMADENIAEFSATSFAEYVCLLVLQYVVFLRHTRKSVSLGGTQVEYTPY